MPDLTDPSHATSLSLRRRAFVGVSAAAAAAGAADATFAAAVAQDALGKPHPPLVPENDPAIVTGTPQITYDARTIGAYYAAPKGAGAGTPGVVVVQAIWGIDAQLRDVVRRFAKEGYVTVAPDLYTGLGAPSGDGATDFAPYREVASKLADDVVDGDVGAAADFLRAASSRGARLRVGVVGFCMGGSIALRQTVDNAARFAAASVFYGKVRYGTTDNAGAITPIALDYARDVDVPLVGSWGRRDTSILADDVTALDAKLGALKKSRDLRVYDGAGHAFFDDTRTSYVGAAATDAWARTLAWFSEHLN